MDMMGSRLVGVSELLASLRELPKQAESRLMKSVVGSGAKVVKDEVVVRAPMYTGKVSEGHPPPGTLKRAVYLTYLPESSTATRTVFQVGVRSGKRAHTRNYSKFGPLQSHTLDAFYWRFVEFGHYARAPKGKRKAVASGSELVPGAVWVMARPFLRPGFEATKEAAVQAMVAKFRERLPEMVAKARAAGGSTKR